MDVVVVVLQWSNVAACSAVQVSEMPHDTFRNLAWHLVYARRLDSDLNKARLAAVLQM